MTLAKTREPTRTGSRPPKPSWAPRPSGTSFPSTARIACGPAREAPRFPSPSAVCQLPSWPISAAASPRARGLVVGHVYDDAGIYAEEGRGEEQRVWDVLFRRCPGRRYDGDDDARRWPLHGRHVEHGERLDVGIRDRVEALFRAPPSAVESLTRHTVHTPYEMAQGVDKLEGHKICGVLKPETDGFVANTEPGAPGFHDQFYVVVT